MKLKTKLIQTKDYLLLIDEKAEIKRGDYILEKERIINVFPDYLTDLDECKKIIAYRKLNEEAKELDLPLLSNPFKEVDVERLAEEYLQKWRVLNNVHLSNKIHAERCKNDFIAGYKAAQTKQLELLKRAIQLASDAENIEEVTEEIIQSLSTQQLPKEFIPEYQRVRDWDSRDVNGDYNSKLVLKIITNSEGKEELVGTYK